MKRIFISGASGFLGKNIIEQTSDLRNVKIIAISSRPELINGVEIIRTDDFLSREIKCKSEDVFINCLFPTNADGYRMAKGLKTVYKMILKAEENGVGSFINISSQSVYGSKRITPSSEEDELCLETPYAVGKFSSEQFCNSVFHDRPHTNIRMASLLGVGYDQRILNRLIDQALNGNKLKIIGGSQRYGFLDVRDAALGLLSIASSNSDSWEETYNLGKNESCTLLDLVCIIKKTIFKITGKEVSYSIEEGTDNRNSAIDSSKFMKSFVWEPNIALDETAEDIIRDKLKRKPSL